MYSVQLPPPVGSASVASVSTDAITCDYKFIYTAEDLKNINDDLTGKYILMNDIDLSSIKDWEGIGKSGDNGAFSGIFDGNGYTIKSSKTSRSLFNIAKNAVIQNVNYKTSSRSSGRIACGGIIDAAQSTTIKNCNCSISGMISAQNYTGGIIGVAMSSTIDNCSVSGDGYLLGGRAGGICGNIAGNSTISNSYFSSGVNFSGGNEHSGTLAGAASTTVNIINCLASTYTGEDLIGDSSSKATITNSTNKNDAELELASTWSSFDSNIWDKTTYPPKLKHEHNAKFDYSTPKTFRIQIGSESDTEANALFVDTGINLDNFVINLSTPETCLGSSNLIKATLDFIAQKASDIGISQSRLETISNVNTTKIENLTAAYSTVAEADVAEEVANFTKSQIMAQTAASLITQTQAFQANLLLRMISSMG